MRPDAEGLHIHPSIPAAWDSFTMEKTFRGKQLSITVNNPDHVQSGVASLTLNGKKLDGDYIPASEMAETNTVEITLG